MASPSPALRIVVLAPHPDDEIIGAGVLLSRARDASVVHVTTGAPRDAALYPKDLRTIGQGVYAALRAREARAALDIAGIGDGRTHALGFVDQEASFDMPALARTLATLFEELHVDVAIAPPYEGGHPDHDATAFAAHAACAQCVARGGDPPALIEMSSYHAHGASIATGCFLAQSGPEEISLLLSEDERAAKRRMLACFPSQREVLAPFGASAEVFRAAPAYDFARPPHDGELYYERLGFRLTGDAWRTLATDAMIELGLARR
jgi:LmbE family N-acetylglucosaminyl deacetylase